MATAILSWDPVAGSTGYLIEYKQASSSIWITPSSPANPTLLNTYPLTVTGGILYNVRLSTFCASGHTTYRYIDVQADAPVVYIWVPDTYTCEQDDVFTLDTTVSGLSSPTNLFYDSITDRYYVIDADDVNGNFWWFDPDTFTAPGGRNYIAGQPAFSPNFIQASDVDPTERRLLAAGPNTGGLIAYDIDTDTFTSVAYGTDGAFARLFVKRLGSNIYCTNQVGTPSVTIINASTLSVITTTNVSAIPSGSTYFNNGYGMNFVNGNIWVYAAAGRASSGDIAVYNSTLTTLLTTITVPSAATWAAGSSRYWQTHFFDEVNDRWWVQDIGSNMLHVIDTTSNTVVHSYTWVNQQGKLNSNFGLTINSVTNDMYGSYTGLDSPSDTSQITRFYKVNRTNYAFEAIFPNQTASSLTNRIGTGEFWAVNPGVPGWAPGPPPGWDTDGQAFKYIQ